MDTISHPLNWQKLKSEIKCYEEIEVGGYGISTTTLEKPRSDNH